MPFCSIKIEMAEVASSAQSMNWCENISLCMKKKKVSEGSVQECIFLRRDWDPAEISVPLGFFACFLLLDKLTGWESLKGNILLDRKPLKNGILRITPQIRIPNHRKLSRKNNVLTFQMCWYLIQTSFGSLKFPWRFLMPSPNLYVKTKKKKHKKGRKGAN